MSALKELLEALGLLEFIHIKDYVEKLYGSILLKKYKYEMMACILPCCIPIINQLLIILFISQEIKDSRKLLIRWNKWLSTLN